MNSLKKLLIAISFCILGVGVGVGALFLLGISPVRFDHPILTTLGIRKPQIVGFLPYWLLDKVDKDYSPYITTFSYFGLAVDVDGKPIYLVNAQEEEPGWTTLKGDTFAAVRQDALKKNFMISLLVHSADEDKIAELIKDPETAAHALVSEVAPIMTSRGFTDLNLDIESFLPASDSARTNYTLFAKTVAEDVRKAKLGTVTIEIPPIALVKKFLIDPIAIGAIFDYVVLMTYDYHYLGSFTAGPVAPIGGAGDMREFDVETAIAEAVRVIPKEKLLLGIPLYGYQWETQRPSQGAATIRGGGSTASSRRVAELLAGCATCSASMDTVSKEPFVVYGEGDYFNQIYFENEASVQEKIHLAQKYQLGGVALWALGYEDDSMLRPLVKYKRSFRLP